MGMKTAGIACDDWKVAKFEEELKAAGHTYTVGAGVTKDTRLIKVTVHEAYLPDVQALCRRVEEFFRDKKSKLN